MTSNSFERVMRDIRRGAALTELSDGLMELTKRVRETGRAGEITFKLKMKPSSVGDVVTLNISDSVDVKFPKPAVPTTIMYATEDGGLQRNDPRQEELALKVVTAPEIKNEELRKVGNA